MVYISRWSINNLSNAYVTCKMYQHSEVKIKHFVNPGIILCDALTFNPNRNFSHIPGLKFTKHLYNSYHLIVTNQYNYELYAGLFGYYKLLPPSVFSFLNVNSAEYHSFESSSEVYKPSVCFWSIEPANITDPIEMVILKTELGQAIYYTGKISATAFRSYQKVKFSDEKDLVETVYEVLKKYDVNVGYQNITLHWKRLLARLDRYGLKHSVDSKSLISPEFDHFDFSLYLSGNKVCKTIDDFENMWNIYYPWIRYAVDTARIPYSAVGTSDEIDALTFKYAPHILFDQSLPTSNVISMLMNSNDKYMRNFGNFLQNYPRHLKIN